MAREKMKEDWHMHKGKGLLLFGFLLIIVGALRLYGVSWEWTAIIVGVLMILKGLWIKGMKM
ncbi:MAG TPA: hypothetical protein VJJ76_00375 [archaeon]|nr:hypothetical protein [archaeon]